MNILLPGQNHLWILGHINNLPAHFCKPSALGAGGKPRTVNHHDRALFMADYFQLTAGVNGYLPERRAIRLGADYVRHLGAVKVGVFSAFSPVNKLIANNKISRLNLW